MDDPGRMDRRITVQTAGVPTPDGGGGWIPGEPTEVETWAYVEPLSGDEQLVAMQTGMQRPHRFTMRYRPDMTSAKSLVYQTRTFDIKSVMDTDAKHMELILLADEIVTV